MKKIDRKLGAMGLYILEGLLLRSWVVLISVSYLPIILQMYTNLPKNVPKLLTIQYHRQLNIDIILICFLFLPLPKSAYLSPKFKSKFKLFNLSFDRFYFYFFMKMNS